MIGNIELLIPILIPIICGIAFLFMGKLNKTNLIKIAFVFSTFVTAFFVVYNCLQGEMELLLWNLTDTMPILFKIDNVSILFSCLTSFIWCLVAVYTVKYFSHDAIENQFYGFFLLTYGVLIALDYSATLVTMYIFYELMTMVTLALVIHTRTKEAVYAALRYLLYSLFGAFMGLMCIFFIDANSPTLNFTAGGILELDTTNKELLLVIAFIGIVGFGTKAGMFPLHGWLPVAHPVAPAPASAVLSGIITKSGVLAIIRLVYYVFGADFIRGTWVQYAWLTLALITVLMGSMMAYKEKILKKRLAYSSVSQISYVVFGLAMLTPASFTGALLHVCFHATIKVCLFLCAGSIIINTDIHTVDKLDGIGRKLPFTMLAFSLSSLALVGIPPFSGFISKWYLAQGSLSSGVEVYSWLGIVVLLVSAILTAGYLFPVCIDGFFPKNKEVIKREKESSIIVVPMLILGGATLILGIFAEYLQTFVETITNCLL